MVGVMKRVDDNSYLEQRGRVWWYNRRVPSKFAHLDSRKRIKESLGTTSIDQARYKRDLLAEDPVESTSCGSISRRCSAHGNFAERLGSGLRLAVESSVFTDEGADVFQDSGVHRCYPWE